MIETHKKPPEAQTKRATSKPAVDTKVEPKPPVPSAKSAKNDCDPPWTRDASGIRVYKKNCVE